MVPVIGWPNVVMGIILFLYNPSWHHSIGVLPKSKEWVGVSECKICQLPRGIFTVAWLDFVEDWRPSLELFEVKSNTDWHSSPTCQYCVWSVVLKNQSRKDLSPRQRGSTFVNFNRTCPESNCQQNSNPQQLSNVPSGRHSFKLSNNFNCYVILSSVQWCFLSTFTALYYYSCPITESNANNINV